MPNSSGLEHTNNTATLEMPPLPAQSHGANGVATLDLHHPVVGMGSHGVWLPVYHVLHRNWLSCGVPPHVLGQSH